MPSVRSYTGDRNFLAVFHTNRIIHLLKETWPAGGQWTIVMHDGVLVDYLRPAQRCVCPRFILCVTVYAIISSERNGLKMSMPVKRMWMSPITSFALVVRIAKVGPRGPQFNTTLGAVGTPIIQVRKCRIPRRGIRLYFRAVRISESHSVANKKRSTSCCRQLHLGRKGLPELDRRLGSNRMSLTSDIKAPEQADSHTENASAPQRPRAPGLASLRVQ
jgi:hypothetical protein